MVWPKNWLQERADELLGWDRAADPGRYSDAFDNLLWAVVTADGDELAGLVGLLYGDPYIRLPAPIQVAAFRLWGLEQPADPDRARAAAAGISLYCSRGEEVGACGGLWQVAGTARRRAEPSAAADRGRS